MSCSFFQRQFRFLPWRLLVMRRLTLVAALVTFFLIDDFLRTSDGGKALERLMPHEGGPGWRYGDAEDPLRMVGYDDAWVRDALGREADADRDAVARHAGSVRPVLQDVARALDRGLDRVDLPRREAESRREPDKAYSIEYELGYKKGEA